jgi:hypothetical protein
MASKLRFPIFSSPMSYLIVLHYILTDLFLYMLHPCL